MIEQSKRPAIVPRRSRSAGEKGRLVGLWCSACKECLVEMEPWALLWTALALHVVRAPMECPRCKAANSLTVTSQERPNA